MTGQLGWLWTATIGQVWSGTTLFGRRTTILVRRLLLYLPLGIYLAWQFLGGEGYSVAARLPMSLLLAPMSAAILLAMLTFCQALWRFINLPFLSLGIFGLPALLFMKFADLVWRLEAGPGPAAVQADSTSADVLEQQQEGQRDRLRQALMYGDVVFHGELSSGLSVQLDTKQGPRHVENPQVRGGKLVGVIDRKEIVVGRVEESGDGYRVVDSSGREVVRFDRSGLGANGSVLVRPRGESEEDWREYMNSTRRKGKRLSGGPMAQTMVAVLVVGVSFGVNSLSEYVAASFSSERDPTGAEGVSPHAQSGFPASADADPLPDETSLTLSADGSDSEMTLQASTSKPAGMSNFPLGCTEVGHGLGGGASSQLAEGRLVHEARRVYDDTDGEGMNAQNSRLRTAWCEADPGDGIGQWVEFHTCCVSGRSPLVLSMAPGYFSRHSTWQKNNRVADAKVTLVSGDASWAGIVNFSDEMEEQYVELPGMMCAGNEVAIRMEILSVFSGTRYKDTCVSDIAIWATTKRVGDSHQQTVLSSVMRGENIVASLQPLSCDELWVARNWVYARHGYAFKTTRAKEFFGSQADYTLNRHVTQKTVGQYLSATDLTNRDLLSEREGVLGCR